MRERFSTWIPVIAFVVVLVVLQRQCGGFLSLEEVQQGLESMIRLAQSIL